MATLSPDDIRRNLFDRLSHANTDMDRIISDTGNTVVLYKTDGGRFWVEYRKLTDQKHSERCEGASKGSWK